MANRYPGSKPLEIDLQICKMRLNGICTTDITEELHISRTRVYTTINAFPKHATAENAPPLDIPIDVAICICRDFLCGSTLPEISEEYEIPVKEILNIFTMITARRQRVPSEASVIYPNLVRWIKIHGGGTNTLSRRIDISNSKFIEVLRGCRTLEDWQVEELCAFTGMTKQELLYKEESK